MKGLTAQENLAFGPLLDLALKEDLGPTDRENDLTSQALLPRGHVGRAVLVSRSQGIVAGLPMADHVFAAVDASVKFVAMVQEGQRINQGDQLATVEGETASLLKAERTALNFLQRLCGVATLTRRFVDAVSGTQASILDTRKTLPGWRLLDKYAVRQGGGHNHRLGLFDAILVKDNHLALSPFKVEEIVAKARAFAPQATFVEIEVDTLVLLNKVLPQKPDIVLLDNMPLDQMREAVRRRDAMAPSVLLEASGGVTLDTVRAIAETGVDRISVGALTHSAPALDIGLDVMP